MLLSSLWNCLSTDAQNRIRLFALECSPHWTPPRPDDSGSTRIHFNVDELEAERLEREVKPIMQATPAEVKHNRGVFAERAV